ncbi:histidine phosphatase family protein [Rhodopirellula sp. SWK7]|uniref:histidine phosphatase family protein n=1 Tax=Rhodopirellula sp. SWK7 TaxID=595460 RepID=UPI0002BF3A8A|nr:histidine phosphatase family protein [Rhodopirellula sp. SWK7]EMI47435.1 Phosphoglycerate/bisphosphoglycerate mutase [Rhodopirellula sp. SWK7]
MSERICILVRHGDYHQLADTPSAHQPFGLTALGRQQAAEASIAIRQLIDTHGWSLHTDVHSSSLLRAWETASLASERLPECKRVVTTNRLTERCVGSGANLTRQQITEAVAADPRLEPLPDDWKSNSHFRLPFIGAESLMESGARVAGYLTETMKHINEPGQAVLVFGHGASLRHAAHHLGVLPFDQIAKLSMFHARPVALSVSSTGVWRHVAGEWKNRLFESKQLD